MSTAVCETKSLIAVETSFIICGRIKAQCGGTVRFSFEALEDRYALTLSAILIKRRDNMGTLLKFNHNTVESVGNIVYVG